MIDISNTQTNDAFSVENKDDDTIVASACSCNNPVRMFWFTPDEIAAEIED